MKERIIAKEEIRIEEMNRKRKVERRMKHENGFIGFSLIMRGKFVQNWKEKLKYEKNILKE